MVQEHFVKGYDEFKKSLTSLEQQNAKIIYVLFTGEKIDGVSDLLLLSCIRSQQLIVLVLGELVF